LDWNLNGEPGSPVARALRARGVPFVISTGYGAVEAEFADVPILHKPYARLASPRVSWTCLEVEPGRLTFSA
jgi:hypothetical protein